MMNFNFPVKSGFAPLVEGKVASGSMVRHRNNAMFYGWVSEFDPDTNHLLIFTPDGMGGMHYQKCSADKFMIRKIDYTKLTSFVLKRFSKIEAAIEVAVDNGDFDEYKIQKNRYCILDRRYRTIMDHYYDDLSVFES